MTPYSFEAAREEALAGFRAAGPDHKNCAQSVLSFGLMRMGLDREILGLARYLGGGVARQGLTCGVLLGCALALGARDTFCRPPADPSVAQLQLQTLTGGLIRRYGSSSCSELTGCDLSTPEGLTSFREEGHSNQCAAMLEWFLAELDQILPVEGCR